MAKRVIKINKTGAPAGQQPQSELGIKGPARPVRLGEETAPAELSRTQPMKRIVVAGRTQQINARAATGSSAAAGKKPQQRKKVQKSGPPLWLIPVGIVGVIFIVIIICASQNSRQDPYYQDNSAHYKEKPKFIPKTGPQPMKAYMEKHGATDMAKERKARMSRRPTTTTKKRQ